MQKTLQIGKTKWICIQAANKETIEKLAQEYDFHEMIVEDILSINAQSKIDTSSKHFFMALTFTKYIIEKERYTFNEMDVIIGENLIVTTTGIESEKMNNIFEKISNETENKNHSYKTSPYYILYRIIDEFYDKTIKSLGISSQKLLDIQENINKGGESILDELINEDLDKIFIKHNFLSQEDIIDDLIAYINTLHERHFTTYFNNLKTKLAKITRTIDILTEKNNSLMSAYNTFLGIRSNKSVTRLTFINSIFLPLTLIAGIGGMSERSMITGQENWKIAYPLFILLCGIIAYISYILLKKVFVQK